MRRFPLDIRDIPAVRRGQIVQRVLVEGWSAARTATAFGIEERHVTRLVAAFRRHGMSSLRRRTVANRLPLWAHQTYRSIARFAGALRIVPPAMAQHDHAEDASAVSIPRIFSGGQGAERERGG